MFLQHMCLYPWCRATNRYDGVSEVIGLCHDGLETAAALTPTIADNCHALPKFIRPESVAVNLQGRWPISDDLAFANGDAVQDLFGYNISSGSWLLRLFGGIFFLVIS